MMKQSERDMRREKIRAEIDRIKAEKEDAMRRLQGREYVHWKQVTAKRRLFKDLDERLGVLEEELADE